MKIIEIASGERKNVIINEVNQQDLKFLTKKRFSFPWKMYRNSTTIYKLRMMNDDRILGAMGLINWPDEKRIEIKLLSSSEENIGEGKLYDGIAGCLIAFACRLAVVRYGPEACVSLVPKTKLIAHYMQKYHMKHAGLQVYLDGENLNKVLKEYL